MLREIKEEVQKLGEVKKPLQYAIYKGMGGKFGALRFSLCPAFLPSLRKDEGVIFLETAPTVGKNHYDWENQKITIALGQQDISKILLFLKTYSSCADENGNSSVNIYHDSSSTKNLPNGTITSTVTISKSSERDSFFWRICKKNKENKLETNIPVSFEETLLLSLLLEQAVIRTLGW